MAISSAVTRQLYLWSVASIYLFAFFSLYIQVPGLYGPRGLAPVHNVIPTLQGDTSLLSQLYEFPSVLVFHPLLGLPPSLAMELCCLVGGALALLMMIFRAMRCTLMFAMLWILYLSLYKVGQVFLWFQWDSLLLEAGFLTILVAPFNFLYWRKSSSTSNTDGMAFWLVRFLLFRLMFASGVVKLTSQCPTWWGLTALNFHYETQCIPTPLAWYAHQFPEWLQKLCVVTTYVIEIAIPLLFFLPVRSLRILGFLLQVSLQVLIIATGNYNFFNLLTVVLCLSLVDDRFLGYAFSYKESGFVRKVLRGVFGSSGSLILSALRILSFVTVFGLVLALTIFYFDVKVDFDNMTINSGVMFSSEGFAKCLGVAVTLTAVVAALSLCVEVANSFLEALFQPGIFSKIYSLFQTVIFGSVVVALFSSALVSHGVLDNSFFSSIPPPVVTLHDQLNKFSVTSPYGLFRRMTGVGGRPEVVFEGTNGDPEKDEWKEYEFLYKPGNVYAPPIYVAPHQPRLDWQMWFAALGHYSNNPWLVNLAHKLLIGEKDVLALMAPPPFSSPPKYIRARLYLYHFTAYDTSQTIVNQTKKWWKREFSSEYLYALTKDTAQLKEFLKGKNYLNEPNMRDYGSPMLPWLLYIRQMSSQLAPPLLLWCLFFSATAASITVTLLCSDRQRIPQSNNQKVDIRDYLAAIQAPDDQQTVMPGTPKAKGGSFRRRKN